MSEILVSTVIYSSFVVMLHAGWKYVARPSPWIAWVTRPIYFGWARKGIRVGERDFGVIETLRVRCIKGVVYFSFLLSITWYFPVSLPILAAAYLVFCFKKKA